jgi:hypothetical protein
MTEVVPCALAGAERPVPSGSEEGGAGRYAARVAVAVENLAMAEGFEFAVVRRRFPPLQEHRARLVALLLLQERGSWCCRGKQ